MTSIWSAWLVDKSGYRKPDKVAPEMGFAIVRDIVHIWADYSACPEVNFADVF